MPNFLYAHPNTACSWRPDNSSQNTIAQNRCAPGSQLPSEAALQSVLKQTRGQASETALALLKLIISGINNLQDARRRRGLLQRTLLQAHDIDHLVDALPQRVGVPHQASRLGHGPALIVIIAAILHAVAQRGDFGRILVLALATAACGAPRPRSARATRSAGAAAAWTRSGVRDKVQHLEAMVGLCMNSPHEGAWHAEPKDSKTNAIKKIARKADMP